MESTRSPRNKKEVLNSTTPGISVISHNEATSRLSSEKEQRASHSIIQTYFNDIQNKEMHRTNAWLQKQNNLKKQKQRFQVKSYTQGVKMINSQLRIQTQTDASRATFRPEYAIDQSVERRQPFQQTAETSFALSQESNTRPTVCNTIAY